MIVSDKNVSDALAYLAIDPHPVSIARKAMMDAETESERVYSILYQKTQGQVDERKCEVKSHSDYVAVKLLESFATMELDRHRQRCKAADMLLEIWRTENANMRAAERIR